VTGFFSARQKMVLLVGDAIVILLVVLTGVVTHGESPTSTHWLATYLPALAAWFLVSPWFGLFASPATRPQVAWRAGLAAVIATPLATILRGLWLGAMVIPIFTVVLSGSLALGMMLWRLIWVFVNRTAAQTWTKSA
jgi:hypothetical protein